MRPWMLLAGLVLAMGPELVPEAEAARASSREARGATARAPSASAAAPARPRAAPAAKSTTARRTAEARRPTVSRATPRATPRVVQRPAVQRQVTPRQAAPRPAPAALIPVALKVPAELPRAPAGSAAICNLSFPCTDEGGRYYVGFDREKIYLSPRSDTTRSAALSAPR